MVDKATWATKEDVEERIGHIQAAGYVAGDIDNALARAEEDLKTDLITVFDVSVVEAWNKSTVPKGVKNLVADLAAAYFFNRVMHQSFEDTQSLACSFKRQVERELKKIRSGEKQILDTAGSEVADAEVSVYSTTTNRTPPISMTGPDDDDYGDGTLDEL
jgi:hypothetical protein